jgi:nitrite reductase (NADH) large subunit
VPAEDPLVGVWRCTVCGYVHEGEAPPDVCPVCGVGPDMFEPALQP